MAGAAAVISLKKFSLIFFRNPAARVGDSNNKRVLLCFLCPQQDTAVLGITYGVSDKVTKHPFKKQSVGDDHQRLGPHFKSQPLLFGHRRKFIRQFREH